MFKLNKIIIVAIFFVNASLYADIGGVVFQEFSLNKSTLNKYGEKDNNEIGVKGVKVTVYPSGKSTNTLANGNWTLDTNQSVRVEFSNWPIYLKESRTGSFYNSSVHFVQDGNTSINFGLYDVNQYNDSVDPTYVTNLISNGSGVDNKTASVISSNYSDTGLNKEFKDFDGLDGNGSIFRTDLNASSIGTVWGKGFQSSHQRMFISSVLWRHAGFALGNPGRIYVLDYSNSPTTLVGSFDLLGLGSVDRNTNSDYILDKNITAPSVDFDAYAKIGKISYGDLDFDNNTQLIWTVNLNENKIISLDANSSDITTIADSIKSYPILASAGAPSCIGGKLRPWGLGINKDKGYIGSICDASISKNSGDLKAYVSEFNLTNPSILKTILSINMDYDRKTLADGVQGLQTFQPWSDERHDGFVNLDYHNQPILSDIDFDAKGNMYLAFLDRFGLQVGHQNYAKKLGARYLLETVQGYGEIFKVCNDDGDFSLEGTGTCPMGISRNGDRDFFDDKGGDTNANPSGGALAILVGSNQVLSTSGDPHPKGQYGSTYWTTNGVQTFNTNSGEIDNWYAHLYSGDKRYTGKSVGLGDIELLTSPVPIELGNRIWKDVNKNGIQDVNEQGLGNILVQLIKGNQVISEVRTDSKGYYLFSNAISNDIISGQRSNIFTLTPNDNYIIRIPNIRGNNQQSELVNQELTLVNKGEGGNSYLNDNDANSTQANNADIIVNSSDIRYGQNNHSFDFGFRARTLPTVEIGNRIWSENDSDGDATTGTITPVVGSVVTATVNSTGISYTGTTDANGNYLITVPQNDTYVVTVSTPVGLTPTANSNDNSITDTSSEDDKTHDGSGTSVVVTTVDNLTVDFGFRVTTIRPIATVQIGNRIWSENDNDGDATTGTITPVVESVVTATANSTGIAYTGTTDTNGNYLITVPQNDTYVVTVSTPAGLTPTANSNDNSITDASSEDDKTHDGSGTMVVVTTVDNLMVDFGFRATGVVLGTTVCQEMLVSDDSQNANPDIATTVIDVLNNDSGTKAGQAIKFLSNVDGEALWSSNEQNITSVTTHDTLTVAEEGTWSVINNEVSFTALNSFDGQIPTPVYYIIDGTDCTSETQYSNVGRIVIITACTCPSYRTKSVLIFNNFMISLLLFLTIITALSVLKKEL